MMEVITGSPNLLLFFSFAALFLTAVCNLGAKWYRVKEKANVCDIKIGNGQTLGDRQKQEDSFATAITDIGAFAVVADGIGSFVNGKFASKLATQIFLREFQKMEHTENLGYFYKRSAQLINSEIKGIYGDIPVGTTVVSALIRQNQLFYAWAGDSTIAVYRGDRLVTLNKKDTAGEKLEELYHLGKLTRDEVMREPYQERLIHYIGQDEFKGINICERPVTLKKGDVVLLYSNGFETLKRIEMEGILSNHKPPQNTAEDFMTAIQYKKAENKDNATVVLLKVNKEYKKNEKSGSY